MQIAQIAPLTEAIPPKLYGGTERVISWLTSELVALGHEVDLFASGDSQTSAQLANGLTILTCCTFISIAIRSPCFPVSPSGRERVLGCRKRCAGRTFRPTPS
jgi:hypothetical protein